MELLAAPLAGSPKFHDQAVIEPAPAGMVEVELLKLTAVLSQVSALYVNRADALSSTDTVFDNVSIHPAADV